MAERIETVDTVDLLTPAPITKGSRVRLMDLEAEGMKRAAESR